MTGPQEELKEEVKEVLTEADPGSTLRPPPDICCAIAGAPEADSPPLGVLTAFQAVSKEPSPQEPSEPPGRRRSQEQEIDWVLEDDPEFKKQIEAEVAGSSSGATQKSDIENLIEKIKQKYFGGNQKEQPFCHTGTTERFTLLFIIAFACWLIPFTWSKSHAIVSGFLDVFLGILGSASSIVFLTLGWGMLAYPIAIAVPFIYLMGWINRFSQADRVQLQSHGLLVRWPSQVGKTLEWTDITSVFLFRPLETMLPEKWLVGFGTSSAQPVKLRLPVLAERGPELLELLKTHCSWASVDPDLIELWEPAIVDSHTELWLKSLSKAPKEAELLPLFPGDLLNEGRYLIMSRIGVGGQGTAYLVKDQKEKKEVEERGEEVVVAEKDVVVKETLFPVFVDEDAKATARARFQHEVNLLAKLDHPNVVKMLDSFIDEHRGYLVLDYIDGESLRQLVKRQGPLEEARVRELAEQMAVILDYLHKLSPPVVHRDFTPENLMLDKSGKLVLIDFNVARELESNKTATVVGKHSYIPPEQFRADADTRSDIYALGATLHYLLTGEDPEPISQSHPVELVPELGKGFDELVAKCTEQDSANRCQSAAEILELLEKSKDQS